MSLGDREAELLDTLEAVIDAELPYVLVGGWAIAVFNQRFTTDVDVVIPDQAAEDYLDSARESRRRRPTADCPWRLRRHAVHGGRESRTLW